MQQTLITAYQVMYSANRFPPRIWLQGEAGGIGQLVFHPNGETLPEDGINGTTPSLHYHLDDFHNAIDLLRNEGPVWLLYSGAGGSNENGLQTGVESVGEGEPPAGRGPRLLAAGT
ncbi:hypothetical protein LDO26_09615 [Luteimonas sp. BDR2-5]|uniref:hypothetical protein n=1 Tax=Proluteimonas luteida TaxID=2878685 RepID=UPI001E45C778|nr:hypothetical protein [Luteimonas sp. BDR2-5]MCD9028464.1 hypothetical protein [Luteimonas sp. BDR2-5]